MARLSCESGSDDEFPALQVVARRVRQRKIAAEAPTTDKENASLKDQHQTKPAIPASLPRRMPLRRRKLGDSQALDNPLFRKWSEDPTESRSRSSRTCSRETKQKTPDTSEVPPQEPSRDLEESDDDVFVRKRRPTKSAVQKPKREPADRRVKTEAVVSVTELDDEVGTIEETMEISAIISEGEMESSEDEESEFVTALSEGVDSDSNYDTPPEPNFLPKSRRSTSPRAQRLTSIQLAPPKEPQKKDMQAKKTSKKQTERVEDHGQEPAVPQTPRAKTRKAATTTGGLEDDFKKLKLYADELDDSPEGKPQTQLDPVTPRKTLQPSPLKAPKIPPSPFKVEHKEFWDVEIQNEWIDRHSPPKRSPKKLELMAGSDKKELLKKKYGTSPEKRGARKAFDQVKENLAQEFLHELDGRITKCQLSKLTAATGGLRIKWSNSLQTTAGRAHWKCKEVTTMVQQPDGLFKSTKERRHEAWIELASKVLTTEDNLLNTVAHEFCHLAVFMLDGRPKFAHGAEFKSWGQKCMDAFKDRGIVVTTKHNYEIDFKFIWRCADCTAEVKRHSKSVDPVKQKCGRCRGTLEQVKPVPRAAGKGKGKSAYQEFVSQEMKVLKAEGRALSFKEMMGVVSIRWKSQQQTNKDGSIDKNMQGLEEDIRELVITDLVSD
ncbi:putative SprT-like family-domain-containing protein [Seiridium cardinale]